MKTVRLVVIVEPSASVSQREGARTSVPCQTINLDDYEDAEEVKTPSAEPADEEVKTPP